MSSYYVRKGRKTWAVYEEIWANNDREQKLVPREAYLALGLRKDMSLDEAKVRVKELNQTHSIERQKAAKAVRNYKWNEIIESTFLPENVCREFADRIRTDNFGSEEHEQRLFSHWKTVQVMIKDLELDVSFYADNKNKVYKYFLSNEWSLDYCKKLLRIFNLWGSFVAKRRGQHFDPVPKMPSNIKELIVEANASSEDDTPGNKESAPLTIPLLKKLRNDLPKSRANWCLISFALGLRPEEVDQREIKVEVDENGITVVSVYQSKLISLPRNKRWKLIAIQEEIQKEALDVWLSGEFERPNPKEVQDVIGSRFTLYAGRKGFEGWQQSLGEELIKISLQLGHTNVNRTLRNYADKSIARYTVRKKKPA
jgi:hypothetical protein